jgi:hypothetical protein
VAPGVEALNSTAEWLILQPTEGPRRRHQTGSFDRRRSCVWNSRAALRHENPPIMRASGTAIPRRSWILRGPLAPQEQTSSDHQGMSEKCQQPTFDISSSFASRNHVAHAVVNCLLYSLDKRRSPPTIEDGAPRPSRRECKARTGHSRAASCSPCLRPAIWRRRTASANRPDVEHSLQGTLAASCRSLRTGRCRGRRRQRRTDRAFRPPIRAF